MSFPKFESSNFRVSNPNEEKMHSEESYNLENEDRDRRELEQEQKGRNAFIPIEEVPDEDAEDAIYEQVQAALDQEKLEQEEEKEVDKFGYVEMLNKIVGQLKDKEKDQFLKDTLIFMPLHQRIVNDEHLSDQEKDELLRQKFEKIIGYQVSARDMKSGEKDFSLHKPKFIRAKEKQAPLNAYHPSYVNAGGRQQAVDSDAQAMPITNTKKSAVASKFKLPFRKKNR